jgi:hypothetical protein
MNQTLTTGKKETASCGHRRTDLLAATLLGKTKRPYTPLPMQEDPTVLHATILALTSALTEMNTELREKTIECEACQGTLQSLAIALQASDEQVYRLQLEKEQQLLKLSAVCFFDRSDNLRRECTDQERALASEELLSTDPVSLERSHVESSIARRQEKKKPSPENMLTLQHNHTQLGVYNVKPGGKPNRLKGTKLQRSLLTLDTNNSTVESRQDDTLSRRDDDDSAVRQDNDDYSPPGKGRDEEPCSNDEASQQVTTTAIPLTVSRDAFYKVIHQRDEALHKAQAFSKELLLRRQQVRQLRTKLVSSTQLIQLSYSSHDVSASSGRGILSAAECTLPKKWFHKNNNAAAKNQSLEHDTTPFVFTAIDEAYMEPFDGTKSQIATTATQTRFAV